MTLKQIDDTLSLGQLMFNTAKLLTIDLPASWMMDKLAPPPPDLRNLDIEAKLKILRGEDPEYGNLENWWSPISWMDKTEQWVLNCIDTSKWVWQSYKSSVLHKILQKQCWVQTVSIIFYDIFDNFLTVSVSILSSLNVIKHGIHCVLQIQMVSFIINPKYYITLK